EKSPGGSRIDQGERKESRPDAANYSGKRLFSEVAGGNCNVRSERTRMHVLIAQVHSGPQVEDRGRSHATRSPGCPEGCHAPDLVEVDGLIFHPEEMLKRQAVNASRCGVNRPLAPADNWPSGQRLRWRLPQ